MSEQQATARLALHDATQGELIRVRGLVQGVGFRPTVWRLAREAELVGDVCNDAEGVLIRLWGSSAEIDAFCQRLMLECPPLGRIDGIERRLCAGAAPATFTIVASGGGHVTTGVVPDAATCAACAAEIRDPADRRFRYPFTNCTHCGPRLSIVRSIPYDRANTSMAPFKMCPACAAEYRDPADRRFHAQPNACPECGPRVWLGGADGADLTAADPEALDAVDAASRLLARGAIVAIKGIGGFHLACDATNEEAVAALRARKRRAAKPFALMARDLEAVRAFCRVDPAEAELLESAVAPIVLLDRLDSSASNVPAPETAAIADAVAPGQSGLGVMLPYSPLHHLLLQDWSRPLVMTSGNLSDEPQCIDNEDALQRLAGIADAWLLNDRAIVNRVDDSVARVMGGQRRWLRRARGAAPAPLALPEGFAQAPPVLALGGELKNTVCLLTPGASQGTGQGATHGASQGANPGARPGASRAQATLSQHLGDLEEARTAREFEQTVALYRQLFEHEPEVIAVDQHPDYRSSMLGRRLAADLGARLIEVQHHAAHLASVLADAGWAADAGPALGLMLDGLGYGSDGTLWGGELLVGDYRHWARSGHLQPFRLPGGERAIREPWRCLYAQLVAGLDWPEVLRRWGNVEAIAALEMKPLERLDAMIAKGLNAPVTTSAGRLFDAVAAALGICRDGIAYEAQAAIELETLARRALDEAGYPFVLAGDEDAWRLDPAPMWAALLDDLAAGISAERIAARFHLGLAEALAELAARAAQVHGIETVALSGGVLQNRTLFEALTAALRARALRVLSHTQVPANDGGLALGQAAIAALAGRS